MSSKRVEANQRRLELIKRRAAEKAAAAAAPVSVVVAEAVTKPVGKTVLDASGAPKWTGRYGSIYCKPLNKRMLLVRWEDETTGKVWCKPETRLKFVPGDAIWAVPDGLHWRLVGRYHHTGRRIA